MVAGSLGKQRDPGTLLKLAIFWGIYVKNFWGVYVFFSLLGPKWPPLHPIIFFKISSIESQMNVLKGSILEVGCNVWDWCCVTCMLFFSVKLVYCFTYKSLDDFIDFSIDHEYSMHDYHDSYIHLVIYSLHLPTCFHWHPNDIRMTWRWAIEKAWRWAIYILDKASKRPGLPRGEYVEFPRSPRRIAPTWICSRWYFFKPW